MGQIYTLHKEHENINYGQKQLRNFHRNSVTLD